MFDATKAIWHVRTSFPESEGAILDHLQGLKPTPDTPARLSRGQHADGGWAWPGLATETPSVGGTVLRLFTLQEAGLAGAVVVERCLDFLSRRRQQGYFWDESEELRGTATPPWLIPGRVETMQWETAGATIALLVGARMTAGDAKASLEFLTPLAAEPGSVPAPAAEALLAALSSAVEASSSDRASALRRPPSAPEKWETVQLVLALQGLRLMGQQPALPLLSGLLDALEARQEEDGAVQGSCTAERLITTVATLSLLAHLRGLEL